MAFSAITTHCSQFVRLRISFPQTQTQTSVSFGFSPPNLRRLKPLSIRSVSLPATPASGSLAPAISLTDNALKHLNKMRSERNEDLCLRIGVKQGGCSGMSYTMDFENMANTRPDDSIIEYEGFLIGMIHNLFLIINIYNPQGGLNLLFLFGGVKIFGMLWLHPLYICNFSVWFVKLANALHMTNCDTVTSGVKLFS
ncbi:iron-sulfur assembly protein IscA, chloroplastic isoform X1 [Abrus precatorius]|uniref:Iron-sulfur assembly protein IscA, chloroplastic isoform X1 n=1 Tax=Abrus precatorius TaxID=3816 RepID=A0A8B8MB73_ABRPR|nr:iron-sulfur assembly protein IscA, chloroplastic isoform X1 [Abrus precatorius]